MKNSIYVLAFFMLPSLSNGKQINSYEDSIINSHGLFLVCQGISPAQFKYMFETSPGIVLDVRTSEEFQKGHLADAQNIDFYEDNFEHLLMLLDSSRPIYVYCHSGGRSSKTVEKLKAMGFSKVYHLTGGFIAWVQDGLPVEESNTDF